MKSHITSQITCLSRRTGDLKCLEARSVLAPELGQVLSTSKICVQHHNDEHFPRIPNHWYRPAARGIASLAPSAEQFSFRGQRG
jgi:hypothetical protein